MVTIPSAIYDAMVAHVRAGYPDEACGILAGNAADRVTVHYPTRNAAADTGGDPHTFSIVAPQDQLAIWNAIEDAGLEMVAYYHSHPATEAYPSPRDIRYSQGWPGVYYAIFTLKRPDQPELRVFLVEGEAVKEVAFQIQRA